MTEDMINQMWKAGAITTAERDAKLAALHAPPPGTEKKSSSAGLWIALGVLYWLSKD